MTFELVQGRQLPRVTRLWRQGHSPYRDKFTACERNKLSSRDKIKHFNSKIFWSRNNSKWIYLAAVEQQLCLKWKSSPFCALVLLITMWGPPMWTLPKFRMFQIFVNINSISYSFRSIEDQNGVYRYSDSTSYFKKYSSSKCKQTVCLHYGLDFHFKLAKTGQSKTIFALTNLF
jgi:hypothetical protein